MNSIIFKRQPSFGRETWVSLNIFNKDARLRFNYAESFWSEEKEIKVMVDLSRARSIFEAATSKPFRLGPGVVGLDGIAYEFTMESGSEYMTLRWWQDLPRTWKHLHKAIELLEELELEARAQHHLPPLDRGEGSG